MISHLLKSNKDQIIEKWKDRVLHDLDIPQAKSLPSLILLNHIPQLLDLIIDGLDKDLENPEILAWQMKLESFTIDHAKVRMDYNYSLPQILKEYYHLRLMIIECVDNINKKESILIHAMLDQSLRQVSLLMHQHEVDLKEKLIAIVSHDLRNPLSSIIFNLQAAYRVSDKSLALYLKRALFSARRCIVMTEDLLDQSQLLAGNQIIIHKKLCNLREIIFDIIYEHDHYERKITFVENGDVEGYWDCDKISQIFSNLLSNAIKHSLNGTEIIINLEGVSDRVEFSIKNQGNLGDGDIFSAYHRDGVGAGAGLGLYIARHVARAHGGDIIAHASDGFVTFSVRLPRL